MPTKISKYEKSTRMIEVVKKCKMMNVSDKTIIDTIEWETGKKISDDQLQELITAAKREIKEQQIEVDTYMDHMIKMGFYTDTMQNHETLATVLRVLFSQFMEESIKRPEEKSVNKLNSLALTIKAIVSGKRELVTDMGFITRLKVAYEHQGEENKEEQSKFDNKVSIMVKNQKEDVDELIDRSIDKKELENNRVA